jgi:predicted N-acetyltransferase YhbS
MYHLLPGNPSAEMRKRYAHLLGEVFGKPRLFTPAYIDWLYEDNPAGGMVGFDALSATGVLAGHYATIPVTYQQDGRPISGLLSLNTVTAGAHQGQGLFTRLAKATYEAAAAQGYQFVVGVANAKSTPGFIRKLGFQLVAPLEARIAFGKVALPDTRDILMSTYNQEQVRWRLANPEKQYYKRQGAVLAPTAIPGLFAQLSSRLENQADLAVCSPLASLWIGHAQGREMPRISFPISERLRPSPLNLIYLDLAGKGVPKAEEIRIEAIDFDAF